jgi:hypothetical protein
MVCFQTKNPNLGKFCEALLCKILAYFMTSWSILRPLEIFYFHLVYFVVILYIFPRFGILDQEKSGNPAWHNRNSLNVQFFIWQGNLRVTRLGKFSPFG